jgi:hypothetical protein
MDQNDLQSYLKIIAEQLKAAGMDAEQVKFTLEGITDGIEELVADEILNKLPTDELKQLDEQQLATQSREALGKTLHTSQEEVNQLYLQKLKEYVDTLPQRIERMKKLQQI